MGLHGGRPSCRIQTTTATNRSRSSLRHSLGNPWCLGIFTPVSKLPSTSSSRHPNYLVSDHYRSNQSSSRSQWYLPRCRHCSSRSPRFRTLTQTALHGRCATVHPRSRWMRYRHVRNGSWSRELDTISTFTICEATIRAALPIHTVEAIVGRSFSYSTRNRFSSINAALGLMPSHLFHVFAPECTIYNGEWVVI